MAISVMSLSACGGNKDNKDETKPTLEVIEPTETEPQETVDKLDDSTKELEIHGVYIGPDGNEMSADEFSALEESIMYENSQIANGEEGNNTDSTLASEENNSSTSDTDKNSSSGSSDEGDTTSNSGDNTSYVEPTLSESEIAEGQRDFTDEEYEAIQNSIDEYTLKKADEEIEVSLD